MSDKKKPQKTNGFLGPAPTRAWRHISRVPGVCDGAACIINTRIPVWMLLRYKKEGASDRSIRRLYPFLEKDELAEAWAYANENKDEMESALRTHASW